MSNNDCVVPQQKQIDEPIATVESVNPLQHTAVVRWKPGLNGSMTVDVGQSLFTQPQSAQPASCWRERYIRLCSRIGMEEHVWNADKGYSEDEVYEFIQEQLEASRDQLSAEKEKVEPIPFAWMIRNAVTKDVYMDEECIRGLYETAKHEAGLMTDVDEDGAVFEAFGVFDHSVPTVSEKVDNENAYVRALKAIKLRLHFMGWPAEAMWNNGTDEKPNWVPDWRYEIALLENALHGSPITREAKPKDTIPYHQIAHAASSTDRASIQGDS